MTSSKKYFIIGFIIFNIISDKVSHAELTDLVVVTDKEIKFISSGKATITVKIELDSITAAAYDPYKNYVYLSYTNKKIYRMKTNGNTAYVLQTTKPIVAKQAEIVIGIAFDHLTSTLYWKTCSGISSVEVSDNEITVPLTGQVLISFFEQQPLEGLVIDVHRKYLYWWYSDSKSPDSKIERSKLDGTDRQTVWEEFSDPLRSFTLDSAKNTLYWIDWRWKPGRSIEKMVLRKKEKKVDDTVDYGTKDTFIYASEKRRPNVIALDKHNVYWINWQENQLWRIPKKWSLLSVSMKREFYTKLENEPIGMFVRSNNKGKQDEENEDSVSVNHAGSDDDSEDS